MVFRIHRIGQMFEYKLSDDSWDENEYNSIMDIVNTNMFTMGEKVKNFEKEFAEKVGAKFSVMVNSGSSANLLAIASLFYQGILKENDEIIVPAVSWSTTYYPLYQYRLKLKFIDVDIETLNIDVELLEKAITKKTRAVFAVNLLGNPNYYNEIVKLCKNYKLTLIEDNCESLGAKYENKNTSTFGIIGTNSTFYSHHICTMEGGVLTTDNEELYHNMLVLRAHGWTRDLPEKSAIYEKSQDSFYESFNFILPGYNLRPIEMEGAIGIAQLEKLNMIIKNRRANAEIFKELFLNSHRFMIQKEVGNSSWFGFSLILKKKFQGKRGDILAKLKANKIDVRPIVAGNFTKNRVIKYFNYEIFGKLQNADYLHENGFFIGNHSKKIYDKIEFVHSLIENN